MVLGVFGAERRVAAQPAVASFFHRAVLGEELLRSGVSGIEQIFADAVVRQNDEAVVLQAGKQGALESDAVRTRALRVLRE